jgi:dienelactone hydrolase
MRSRADRKSQVHGLPLRFIVLTLLAAIPGASSAAAQQSALKVERVRFESAPQPLGNLQQKQARERGEQPKPIRGDMLEGYLARPEGEGPFPAIVQLHGCAGLGAPFKANPAGSRWIGQLVEWGYVVLVVDSFSTRNVREACTPASFFAFSTFLILTRALDAFGGLQYLSHLPYVDRSRVAMLGFSMGGWTALTAASERPTELFDNPDGLKFKAAVAFYPICTFTEGIMAVPTLILIGASDDWSSARSASR